MEENAAHNITQQVTQPSTTTRAGKLASPPRKPEVQRICSQIPRGPSRQIERSSLVQMDAAGRHEIEDSIDESDIAFLSYHFSC